MLTRYQGQGFVGSWCEGGTLNLLMKSAAFPVLVRHNSFHSRSDARSRFFEAQAVILAVHREEILAAIGSADQPQVLQAAEEILSDSLVRGWYPNVSLPNILRLWEALGPRQLKDIARLFLASSYNYRAGWPDLTLVRGHEVRFVEVKTTDLIHASQRRIIQAFATPLRLDFSVAQVVPLEAGKA